MISAEVQKLIQLNLIPGIGSAIIRRLMDSFVSASEIFETEPDQMHSKTGLRLDLCRRIARAKTSDKIGRELDLIEKHNCSVITLTDEIYPKLLKEIPDPPPFFYIKGKIPATEFSIAIVGTRRPTSYGKKTAYQLAYQLADLGFTIVSGGAKGIDSMAHRGTLDNDSPTIAVMGCGLSQIYPATNKDLFDEITENNGALISEFAMSVPPKAKHFPRRNRLISGMTLGAIVVEASDQSGSLITARLAGEQGREVFAVPGEIGSQMSRGAHALINKGATLVNSIDDILETLSIELVPQTDVQPISQPTEPETIEPTQESNDDPNDELDPDQRLVLSVINDQSIHIDQIVNLTKLPAYQVSGILTILEIYDLVKIMPGNLYKRVN